MRDLPYQVASGAFTNDTGEHYDYRSVAQGQASNIHMELTCLPLKMLKFSKTNILYLLFKERIHQDLDIYRERVS